MEREDKRGIFLGVVGVLTLIVAIIGASLAYFSVNTRSRENAITVNAASVQIVYEDGTGIDIDGLIPATQAVAFETQRRALAGETDEDGAEYEVCIDDPGYRVCGIYDFTLTNKGNQPVDVKAYVVPTQLAAAVKDPETQEVTKAAEKGFRNLKFVMFDISDVTSETPVEDKNGTQIYSGTVGYDEGSQNYVEKFGLLSADTESVRNLPGNNTTKKYRLFIWLDEAGPDNDIEQGAVFKGTVHIDLAGVENNEGITGNVDSSLKKD